MQALLAALHALVDSQPRSDYCQSYLTGLHAQQHSDYAYTTTATADLMLSLLTCDALSLYRLCDSSLRYAGVSVRAADEHASSVGPCIVVTWFT